MEQWLVEGVSRPQVLRETGVHWKTLAKIQKHGELPGSRQEQPRERPKLGSYLGRNEAIPKQNAAMPRKQRHTAKRPGNTNFRLSQQTSTQGCIETNKPTCAEEEPRDTTASWGKERSGHDCGAHKFQRRRRQPRNSHGHEGERCLGSMEQTFSEHLIKGRPFIQFDNVRRKLESECLESFVTGEGTFNAEQRAPRTSPLIKASSYYSSC